MGLFFSERRDLSNIWYWIIVVVLAFAAMGVAGQTTPTPPAAQKQPTPDLSPTVEDSAIDNTAADLEIQRRFDHLRNELRRELLDDRADTINWWLTAVAIFLAVLGIVAVLVGYIGFSRFREIEAEARENVEQAKQHAEEARETVKEIKEQKKQAEEAGQEIKNILSDSERQPNLSLGLGDSVRDLSLGLGDSVRDNEPPSGRVRRESDPDQTQGAEEAVQEVRQIPEASPIDQAIADAYSLQRAGRIEEAIEKWRAIANVMEGIDNDLAAHAWLSFGNLLYERGGEDDGDQ